MTVIHKQCTQADMHIKLQTERKKFALRESTVPGCITLDFYISPTEKGSMRFIYDGEEWTLVQDRMKARNAPKVNLDAKAPAYVVDSLYEAILGTTRIPKTIIQKNLYLPKPEEQATSAYYGSFVANMAGGAGMPDAAGVTYDVERTYHV